MPSLADQILASWFRLRLRGFRTLTRVFGRRQICVKTKYGSVFCCDPDEYIGMNVLRHGFYESEVIEALRPSAKSGGVYWDVGSNFGLHAVTAAVEFPDMQVAAFEPVDSLRALLEKHACLNKVNLRLSALALSDSSGSFELYVPPLGAGGRATLCRDYAGPDWRRVTVTTARADELILSGELPMPNLMKVDVEGAEVKVLSGFGDLLSDPRLRAVVIEGVPGLDRSESTDPLALILRRAGFQLRVLERREPTMHDLENYVATRP